VGGNTPVVESISSPPTLGGYLIVSGVGFGNNASQITVSFGSIGCTNVTVLVYDTEFTCEVLPGSGVASVDVQVVQQTAVSLVSFSYQGKNLDFFHEM
jgi:hypothetical protein